MVVASLLYKMLLSPYPNCLEFPISEHVRGANYPAVIDPSATYRGSKYILGEGGSIIILFYE